MEGLIHGGAYHRNFKVLAASILLLYCHSNSGQDAFFFQTPPIRLLSIKSTLPGSYRQASIFIVYGQYQLINTESSRYPLFGRGLLCNYILQNKTLKENTFSKGIVGYDTPEWVYHIPIQ